MAKPKQIELCDGTIIPILYEDRNVLALDKPTGWMLAPNTWVNTSRNLQLALESSMLGRDFWAKSRNLKFIRYIHRLDADASGILLMAKNMTVLGVIGKLFEERKVFKKYYAIIEGIVDKSEWSCDFPLVEDIPARKYVPGKSGIKAFESGKGRVVIDKKNGKDAYTEFKVVATSNKRTLVEAVPYTGRTHQIRVHLQASAYPIVGDPLYGEKGPTLALRAVELKYRDSFQKKNIEIHAPVRHFLHAYGFAEYEKELQNVKSNPPKTEEKQN